MPGVPKVVAELRPGGVGKAFPGRGFADRDVILFFLAVGACLVRHRKVHGVRSRGHVGMSRILLGRSSPVAEVPGPGGRAVCGLIGEAHEERHSPAGCAGGEVGDRCGGRCIRHSGHGVSAGVSA
ncbi:hypothetical protein DSECCO2_449580 [anaerobic digester metagenome]